MEQKCNEIAQSISEKEKEKQELKALDEQQQTLFRDLRTNNVLMKQKQTLREKEEKIAKLKEELPDISTADLDKRLRELTKQIEKLDNEV